MSNTELILVILLLSFVAFIFVVLPIVLTKQYNNDFISFISVYRNGETEYSIYDAAGVYVDDLNVIEKPDGTREIKYRPYE